MQYYNLDLVAELEHRPVRALNLLFHLPPGSRLQRSFTGGLEWGWNEEILSQVAELVHAGIKANVAVTAGKKAARKIKDYHIPRPWEVQTGPRRVSTVREMVGALGPMLGRGSYG